MGKDKVVINSGTAVLGYDRHLYQSGIHRHLRTYPRNPTVTIEEGKAVLLAYLQLGYHPDVADRPAVTGERAVEYLDRSVHRASAAHAGDYRWGQRRAMADAVRDDVDADVETLEQSRLESGVVYDVTYNGTAASAWSDRSCESGDGKRFGPCRVDDGVVLQERAGEAVLLAVGFDVGVVGPDGETELTVVVEVGG